MSRCEILNSPGHPWHVGAQPTCVFVGQNVNTSPGHRAFISADLFMSADEADALSRDLAIAAELSRTMVATPDPAAVDIPVAPLDEDANWPRYACVCGHAIEDHINDQGPCRECDCEDVCVPPER